MQIDLQAKIAGGGQVAASGQVRVNNGNSNLKLTIAEAPLAPLQSYLSQFADLRIAGGTLSAAGRLRYGDPAGAGARLAYDGRIAVEQVLLEEVEPPRPFLAWGSIATDDMALTLWPHRVDIGELRVENPSGRLIIDEDHRANLMGALKKPKEHEPAVARHATGSNGFPVTIARVRVSGGVMEFSDLSLRPPFGVRMHELHGVITGLGSDASASIQEPRILIARSPFQDPRAPRCARAGSHPDCAPGNRPDCAAIRRRAKAVVDVLDAARLFAQGVIADVRQFHCEFCLFGHCGYLSIVGLSLCL